MAMNIFVLGPAGCGKTTFVHNFSSFLRSKGYEAKVVNLDPGVKKLIYSPSWDVRELITVEKLMEDFNLGPNGALVKAMDFVSNSLEAIAKKIPDEADFVLFDTPGQMEVFAFREIGPKIVEKFWPSMAIFLIDGEMLRSISDFVVFYLVSIATEMRLGIDTVKVVNKSDLIKNFDKSILMDMRKLKKKLDEESGIVADLSKQLTELLEKVLPAARIPFISSIKNTGFDEVFDLVYEIKCTCGDLT